MPDDMIDAVQRLVRPMQALWHPKRPRRGIRRGRPPTPLWHPRRRVPTRRRRAPGTRTARTPQRARERRFPESRRHNGRAPPSTRRRRWNAACALYDCSGGFVACRFDAQYDRVRLMVASPVPVCFVMSPAADVSPAAPATPPLPLNPTMRGSRSSAITIRVDAFRLVVPVCAVRCAGIRTGGTTRWPGR